MFWKTLSLSILFFFVATSPVLSLTLDEVLSFKNAGVTEKPNECRQNHYPIVVHPPVRVR